jgi:hypothetical protein
VVSIHLYPGTISEKERGFFTGCHLGAMRSAVAFERARWRCIKHGARRRQRCLENGARTRWWLAHRTLFRNGGVGFGICIGQLSGLVLRIRLPAYDKDKDNQDQFFHGYE